MSDEIFSIRMGEGARPFFWGHGWGQNHQAFVPLAQSLPKIGAHTLIDFQGFGQSAPPPEDWGTAEYADYMASFIRARSNAPVFWVGHSFGCRVGIQLAARHPDLVAGMCLIAAAGLPRKRSLGNRIYHGARIKLFKFLKKLIPLGLSSDWLYTKFGSADYKSAGVLRTIFVRVVNEDLSDQARAVQCPVLLIYGENDDQTPPEIGQRLKGMIKNSELFIMDGYDHYSILGAAQHQVAHRIQKFVKELPDP